MEKEVEKLEQGPKGELHLDSLKATLKKYQTGKIQALVAYTDSGLKYLHPSKDQGKDQPDLERLPKRNHPKEL